MTEDDYKELIKFHLMFTVKDLSDVNFVAVDFDGWVWGYNEHPTLERKTSGLRWIQIKHSLQPLKIAEIEPEHPSWNKIVIEL